MNSFRDAVLLGTSAAAETQVALRIRETVEANGGAIDVFGVIEELGVSLLFRPLDGLLGMCVRMPEAAGIVVTTRRDLHLQRFTAAHELGHFVLEHEGSLDREVGTAVQTASRDLREVSADAFAAEFLLPKWLFVHHAKRRGWTRKHLSDPLTVYQLSLRMAVSYDATCLGLLAHRILDRDSVDHLRNVAPKKSKLRALGDTKLEDSRADVWLLTDQDDGEVLEAGPGDMFVFEAPEHSGAGYLWDTHSIEASGFAIVRDDSVGDDDVVGGPSRRRIILKGPEPGAHHVSLLERRPWEEPPSPLRTVSMRLSTFGAHGVGLPRRARDYVSQPVMH